MVFRFNSNRKGYGSNGVPGFNNSKKRGTIARGNFDGDRKPNRGDCDPFDFKKQDGGEQFMGGKDPFESKMRITQEKDSGKWIVSGDGIFEVADTEKEAQKIMRSYKK